MCVVGEIVISERWRPRSNANALLPSCIPKPKYLVAGTSSTTAFVDIELVDEIEIPNASSISADDAGLSETDDKG